MHVDVTWAPNAVTAGWHVGATLAVFAGDACQQDLTPAQQQALARDGQAALGAMGSAQPVQ